MCYSRMSIEQVRPILDCFCQILSLNEFSTISSNVLYAAKFDRNDAVRLKIYYYSDNIDYYRQYHYGN